MTRIEFVQLGRQNLLFILVLAALVLVNI